MLSHGSPAVQSTWASVSTRRRPEASAEGELELHLSHNIAVEDNDKTVRVSPPLSVAE